MDHWRLAAAMMYQGHPELGHRQTQGMGQFLRQDSWMNEMMHPFYEEQDGWVKERMFRPDVVLTTWRKLIEEHARGIQEKPSF